MILRLWCFFALGLLASACGQGQAVAPQKQAQIKSVAIVSAFADQVHFYTLGEQIWDFPKSQVDTVDWKIDPYVKQLVRDTVKGRFAVIDVNYNVNELLGEISYSQRVFGDNSAVAARLKRVIPPGAADAVIYVGPHAANLGSGLKALPLEGLGLYRRDTLYSGPDAGVYALYKVVIFDGRDFSLLGESVGRQPSTDGTGETPRRRVSWAWPGPGYAALARPYREAMLTALQEMLRGSLPATVNALLATPR